MKMQAWFCCEHYPRTRRKACFTWPGRTPALGRLPLAPHLPGLWENMDAFQSPACKCRDREKPLKMWQEVRSRCQQLGRWGTCWENGSSAERQHTQAWSPSRGCSLKAFLPETASWEPSLSHCPCNHVGWNYKMHESSTHWARPKAQHASCSIYSSWQNTSQTN